MSYSFNSDYNSGMDKAFIYQVDDKDYQVQITYKRVKNINYRYKDGVFFVSCSRFRSISAIKSGLDKFAKRLIKRTPTRKGETEEYIYIFGDKYDFSFPGEITLPSGDRFIYKTIEDLHKKLKKWFLNYATIETHKMAETMSAPQYRVKVRKMVSRYGTNSRHTKSITYSLTLLHYSPEIIESVIVHELVHCFVFNHSDNFYRLLYKYSPDYDILRKKLIKAEFK